LGKETAMLPSVLTHRTLALNRRQASGRRRSRLAVFSLSITLFLPTLGFGQEVGTITGQVVDETSTAPLTAVQVYLEGTGIGTLTSANGRYILVNVPAGSYTVIAERIGYGTLRQDVTVQAGGTHQVNFAIVEEPLGLDEIVVTGTAGAARRREVGNSISQISLATIDEPITSVDALIQGRGAGITVTENTGQVGGGASIRLRGNVSAAMSNQPLIYVDGIRVRSDGLPKNVPDAGYGGRGPNTAYGPLNDIEPSNIERIEVIKGAAATTLYGTEASAGVIQIFTKRGQVGRPRWTAQIDAGVSHLAKFGPTEGFHGEELVIPANEKAEHGSMDYMYVDPYLDNPAPRYKTTLSVSGGREDIQYFLSGSWNQVEGTLRNDMEDRYSVRGNLTFSPIQGLQVDWNSAFSKNDISQTAAGPNAQGIILNTFRRERNYLGTTDPEVVGRLLEYENNEVINRYITGVTATYAPTAYLTQRLTLGYDVVNQETSSLRPFGFISAPDGIAHNRRWENTTLTLDYVGTFDWRFTEELRSSFSVGGQAVTTEENWVSAYGEDFPGPGDAVVSSAAQTLGFEGRMRIVNGGFFLQELLDFRNKYFLTLGLRVDGNSAFGEDLGLEAYPKASFSYVLSDESFWNPDHGQVKLRAAWGQAGRAPGAFDAVRTWDPVGWGGQPAFQPNNLGNSKLGPERTSEIELGFDGSFFDDRLAMEFTYYSQETSDALFSVRQPPSAGFGGSQLTNVGKIENKGIEFGVNYTILDRRDWGADVGGSVYTNNSKVLDLGGAAEFGMGGRGYIVEGQPVPVLRGFCVTNPNEKAEPIIEADCNYGPNLPTKTFGINTMVRMPYSMNPAVRGEYQGGHYAYNVNDGESYTRGIRWPSCFHAYPDIDSGNISNLTAIERARCIASNANRDFAIYPQDFFKVREITFSAPVPFAVPGANEARVILSARNAIRWQKAKYTFADPETSGGFQRGDTGLNEATHTIGGSIPTAAIYTFSLRLNF
jgi:TonB-linked SusC/RagA family outer membrane protein